MKKIFSENCETNFEFFNQWCNELMWTISGALNWYNCTRTIPFKNNLLKPKFLALLKARRAPFDLARIASPIRSKEAHVKRIVLEVQVTEQGSLISVVVSDSIIIREHKCIESICDTISQV